jgi:acyl-CoA thioesterase I
MTLRTMTLRMPYRRLAAGALACVLAPAIASAQPTQGACAAPKDLMRLARPLARTADRLAKHEPLTIVAIGSSSTAGAGASSAAASYPSRLAVELKTRFPTDTIRVINRGVNGEEAGDMLARFGESVIKEKPDLVLWQVGTNSVLRARGVAPVNPLILDGIRQLKEIGADVVMIDLQYAPRVIERPDAGGMVRLISAAAKETNVDLIQRFAVMRFWHDQEHLDFTDFISPDGVHMNDWSYACLAKLIGASIVEAATRNAASAHAALPGRLAP